MEDQFKKLAALTGVVLMATAKALAQDKCSRPRTPHRSQHSDRQLAVLEGTPHREGLPGCRRRAEIAQPGRRVQNHEQHPGSDVVHQGQNRPSRQGQSARHAVDGIISEGPWHTWNEPAGIHWPQRFSRVHPLA
jgi:hypothetical protein